MDSKLEIVISQAFNRLHYFVLVCLMRLDKLIIAYILMIANNNNALFIYFVICNSPFSREPKEGTHYLFLLPGPSFHDRSYIFFTVHNRAKPASNFHIMLLVFIRVFPTISLFAIVCVWYVQQCAIFLVCLVKYFHKCGKLCTCCIYEYMKIVTCKLFELQLIANTVFFQLLPENSPRSSSAGTEGKLWSG